MQAATTLKVYPAPSGVTLNTAYTVKVRVPGGVWQDLDEYQTQVDNYHRHNVSFVYFDTDGPVDISVTDNLENITSATIRPTNKNITPTINGNTMTFSISGPMKLSAVVNGDLYNTLDIFANPVEVNPPSPTDPNVIYVGPGYYTQDYTVPSGKTLYLAGGAVIKGEVFLDNATNAKLIGRGVIDHPPGRAVSANYANQITIDGIIISGFGDADNGGNAVHIAGSTNVIVNNVKAYSSKKWTDGIDTFNASYITINDIFMRTSDDAIAIYGSRANGGNVYSGFYSSHINVTNSILTPDTAHPINIGTHGDPTLPGGGNAIDSLSFSNLDIWSYHQALPISVAASDGNLITDVTFTDLRIEDQSAGRVADAITYKSSAYGLGPGSGVNNIYFKNITYTSSNAGGGQIYGYDANRLTQNVTFENLKVNGNVITSASAGNFSVGNYTNNINFIATGGSVPAPAAIPDYTPTNLALNKTVSADSTQSGHSAASGNDVSTTTRWCANDGNTGHSWKVDLGSTMDITGGTQVMWEQSGKIYKYKIETSNDNVNWTLKVDKSANTSTDQVQNDVFYDTARYVRITVTGLESGVWASFNDFKVLGEPQNLALGKTASSDSTLSGNPAANGTDGYATTPWSANDGNTGHWLMVDLGSNQNITYGTQVLWPQSGAAYQYKVETSTDNINWTLKVDKTGNTDTNQVQSDLFTGTARYVRITVTGLPSGTNASFYDFKVFGNPTNLTIGKTASSDSSQTGSPASNGNDGNTTTSWSANDGAAGHWWMVDLGTNMTITNGTQVMWPYSGTAYQYKIETSTDNTNWTLRIDKTSNNNNAQVQSDYFTGIARYVRITVTGMPSGTNAGFYEFKVFGDPSNLALSKTASADSAQTANPASKGNDGNYGTRWCANDGNTGHWWTVDLGSSMNITGGTQVKWEQNGVSYKYKIETSNDNINWTLKADKTASTSTDQFQSDPFTGTARYVRITVTGLPTGVWASFWEFKVIG